MLFALSISSIIYWNTPDGEFLERDKEVEVIDEEYVLLNSGRCSGASNGRRE